MQAELSWKPQDSKRTEQLGNWKVEVWEATLGTEHAGTHRYRIEFDVTWFSGMPLSERARLSVCYIKVSCASVWAGIWMEVGMKSADGHELGGDSSSLGERGWRLWGAWTRVCKAKTRDQQGDWREKSGILCKWHREKSRMTQTSDWRIALMEARKPETGKRNRLRREFELSSTQWAFRIIIELLH